MLERVRTCAFSMSWETYSRHLDQLLQVSNNLENESQDRSWAHVVHVVETKLTELMFSSSRIMSAGLKSSFSCIHCRFRVVRVLHCSVLELKSYDPVAWDE